MDDGYRVGVKLESLKGITKTQMTKFLRALCD
jgi:hypothetical protein